MLKRLRIYYLYAALPFIALLVGAAYFYQEIAKTITANPHPQINYAIFGIIVFGGLLILRTVHKLMDEARALSRFSSAIQGNVDKETLQKMALALDVDIAYVLRMLASTRERSVSHQEQVAIEHELEKVSTRLNARTALPQFLTGLLVGMGLLGTFVGLLATLGDISALISSFADLDMAKSDPIEVFRNLIERMKAPMQSMGIAFSASLFGLLGSIILGFMMVATRRCLGDIVSLVGSEVHQHIEFSLADVGSAKTFPMSRALTGTRGASPALADELIVRTLAQPLGSASSPTPPSANSATDERPNTASTPKTAAPETVRSKLGETTRPRDSNDYEYQGEELRILLRIEDRLAETAKLQLRNLNSEIDDFQKQRADMLRVISESTEAATAFRSELQRVGRQLGSMLQVMENGNGSIASQLSELMVRMADEATESRMLMIRQMDEQRVFAESLMAAAQAATSPRTE